MNLSKGIYICAVRESYGDTLLGIEETSKIPAVVCRVVFIVIFCKTKYIENYLASKFFDFCPN